MLEVTEANENDGTIRFVNSTELKLFFIRRCGRNARRCRAHSFLPASNLVIVEKLSSALAHSPGHGKSPGSKSKELLKRSKVWTLCDVNRLCEQITTDRIENETTKEQTAKETNGRLRLRTLAFMSNKSHNSDDKLLTGLINFIGAKLQTEQDFNFDVNTANCDELHLRVLDLFVAHLQLLVNCRDELATAKALVTDGQAAFYCLRKKSIETRMPMCQTAISYITRNHLGGAGYKDWASDMLNPHVAVYRSFVDAINQMHEAIEEVNDPVECVTKLVNKIIHRRIGAVLTDRVCQSALNHCASLLVSHAGVVNNNINIVKQTAGASPQQSISKGGSRAGRSSLVLIECLVDRMTCYTDHARQQLGLQSLNGSFCVTPKTPSMHSPGSQPTRLQSITQLFSSPEVQPVQNPTEDDTATKADNVKTPEAEPKSKQRPVLASFINDKTPTNAGSNSMPPMDVLQIDESQQHDLSSATVTRTPLSSVTNVTPRRADPNRRPSLKRKQLLMTDNADRPVPKLNKAVSAPAPAAKLSKQKTSSKVKVKQLKGQTNMLSFFQKV